MVDKSYGLFLLEKAKESEYGALLIKKTENIIEDFVEFKFIYNTEEEQMRHKEIMEESFYKCYQCGVETLYRNYDKEMDSDKGYFQNNVRVPTSIFGISKKGLLYEAKGFLGYCDRQI